MSYESPINIYMTRLVTEMDDYVVKKVLRLGVDVNKDELVKALTYDREQYEKGYADRDAEIIRCCDCKYWQDNNGGYPHEDCRWGHEETPDPDDFCSFAERAVKLE